MSEPTRLRDRAALLAWSGATALALFGVILAIDRAAPDPVIQGFAAYGILTGLGSIALAYANRQPALLGQWAWLAVLAWAAHLWALVWLINIGALDVHAFLGEPRPLTAMWMAVLVFLGVSFVIVESLAIRVLRRRIRERLRELD